VGRQATAHARPPISRAGRRRRRLNRRSMSDLLVVRSTTVELSRVGPATSGSTARRRVTVCRRRNPVVRAVFTGPPARAPRAVRRRDGRDGWARPSASCAPTRSTFYAGSDRKHRRAEGRDDHRRHRQFRGSAIRPAGDVTATARPDILLTGSHRRLPGLRPAASPTRSFRRSGWRRRPGPAKSVGFPTGEFRRHRVTSTATAFADLAGATLGQAPTG